MGCMGYAFGNRWRCIAVRAGIIESDLFDIQYSFGKYAVYSDGCFGRVRRVCNKYGL